MVTKRSAHAPVWRALIGLGVAAAAFLTVTSVAEATQFQKVDHYSGSFPEDIQLCGLSVHHTVTFSGTFAIHAGNGAESQAYFARDNYRVEEIFTNVNNHKFFTLSANGVRKDVKATLVEGTVFKFVSHDVGQPFVVRNMDGQVVLRDRGRLEFTYLFDTLGDSAPGGVTTQDLGVRVSGPHPGFFLTDFCPGIIALIG